MIEVQSSGPGVVLLFDGGCALCRASVRFILSRERSTNLHFASLDGAFGAAVVERHPWINGVDSVMWFERRAAGAGETVLVKSDAVLRIARYLGGPWKLAAVARVAPRKVRDAVYDLVARHRHHLWKTGSECLVPAPVPEDRERFLD